MLTNIFFDLDGTLTDPRQGITRCMQHALAKLGRPFLSEFELQQYIGPPLRSTFKKLLCTDDQSLVEKAVALYRERFTEVGIFENAVYPGIVELLSRLSNKSMKLYVVTIKPKIYADRIVEHFQLTRYFHHIYGTELDGSFDNKAEHIEIIMHQHNLSPLATAMVGDRKEDINAGKSNHITTIGVTYGFGSEQEINQSAPDYICNCPAEIQNIFLEVA
jgi:phosphoglycolate phosphatase